MKRYEPIRKYIHLTDKRNTDLSVTNLVGLTIEKRYIPSVANVIGTDLSKYKVIKQGQFACSLMQVSRDGKMPVAMYKGEPSIMSPAYPIFEVNDENELMPEYLHMYLSRPEFDREAVFRAVGGVRGSLDWEDFLDMKMPIPSIEEQRKIVAEYQAVEQRIENNNRLIKALEDTAQAIYHHTFVENIDPENLPEGWKWGKLSDIANINMGQSPEGESLNTIGDGDIFYQGRTDFGVRFPDIRVYTTEAKKYAASYDILISVRAPVGDLNITRNKCAIGRGIAAITPKIGSSFVFYTLQNQAAQFKKSNDEGTIFGSIGKEDLFELKVLVPEDKVVNEFNSNLEDIDKIIDTADMENSKMLKVKDLLLAKLS